VLAIGVEKGILGTRLYAKLPHWEAWNQKNGEYASKKSHENSIDLKQNLGK